MKNKTNTDFKMALIKMFKENDLDEKFVNETQTKLLIEEYEEEMQQFELDYKLEEKKQRNKVIESLTKEELHKIKDLYMQELIDIYEKENHANLVCYTK